MASNENGVPKTIAVKLALIDQWMQQAVDNLKDHGAALDRLETAVQEIRVEMARWDERARGRSAVWGSISGAITAIAIGVVLYLIRAAMSGGS